MTTSSRITSVVNGFTTEKFSGVRDAFEKLWLDDDAIEVGASIAIYHRGEKVASLWGGWTDRERTLPWQESTLVNVYSTSKGLITLGIAALVSAGRLDLDAPVAHYWPEFGAQGKFDITMAQLLSHQAGLCGFDPPAEVADLYDWKKMTYRLAAQRPQWAPGTKSGYHAITWGFLVGEVIGRVTGQMPGPFLRESITDPIGADFLIGLTESELPRCATMIGPNHIVRSVTASPAGNPAPLEKQQEKQQSLDLIPTNDPALTPYRDVSSAQWRKAQIPASNGHATADGLARVYAMAAQNGKWQGKEIINKTALDQVNTLEIDNKRDLVLGTHLRRSRGFILNCDDVYMGPSALAFGHSGTGGSIGFADPENEISFAYVMNQMQASGVRPSRAKSLIDTIYAAV